MHEHNYLLPVYEVIYYINHSIFIPLHYLYLFETYRTRDLFTGVEHCRFLDEFNSFMFINLCCPVNQWFSFTSRAPKRTQTRTSVPRLTGFLLLDVLFQKVCETHDPNTQTSCRCVTDPPQTPTLRAPAVLRVTLRVTLNRSQTPCARSHTELVLWHICNKRYVH